MRSNRKIDHQYLLKQLLTGKLTSAEIDDLRDYIQNSFHDKDLDLLMRSHWFGLEDKDLDADEMQFRVLKNQIISRINQIETSSAREYWLFPTNWKKYLVHAAAVLFIPLLIGSLFVFYRMDNRQDQIVVSAVIQQVIANPGSRIHFVLPDQTEVWLNSGSMLEFPVAFNQKDNRKVKLTGQGYFKVSHDQFHPFIVETHGLYIKALGTSFDVSSYDNDKQISSTLEEGSIALINLKGDEITRLHPGQRAILEKSTKVLLVRDVETKLTTSWKDGKLIFRNTSLSDVTIQLERWFNCKIHVNAELMNSNLQYTATIQDETLGEVLKMIEISTSVKTKIEKREVYIERKE